MADAVVNATIELAGNATEVALQVVEESPYGVFVAYLALLTMALLPIYFASYASAHAQAENTQEHISSSDAAMFPVYASCSLFGLYALFKLLPKEFVNLILGVVFFFISLGSFAETIRPIVIKFCPASWATNPFHLALTKKKGEETIEYFVLDLDYVDLVCLAISAVICALYFLTKNWVANNLLGLAFSYSGIKHLSLGSMKTSCILLAGLFVYDVFWVFGTDVMVTVAKNFDAPIKVVFPRDIFVDGVFTSKHSMLGLGDIVMPGILVALLLRFDIKEQLSSRPHFHSAFLAYIGGLVTTIFVMHTFKAAQPALLYLVPFCILIPLAVSAATGNLTKLWSYTEEAPKPTETQGAATPTEDKKDQ